MRKKWFWAAACVLLACVLVSCTTKNMEQQKLIAEKKRVLGEAYFREQKHPEALREYLEAEELYSNDHFLHDDLGRVYLAMGRYDLAISHFKKSLEIKKDFTPARNNLGNAYAVKKEFHETSMKICKPIVNRVSKSDPDHYSSDCPMAGHQIENGLENGKQPEHPLRLMKLAYGL